MNILQTTDLKKYYGTEPNITKALDGVTLSIEEGEFVAIVGTSGSGKSTLLNMMGGLDTPTSGSIKVKGKELSKLKDEQLTIFRRRNIGFIFQNYNLVPVLNVYENIVLPASEEQKEILQSLAERAELVRNGAVDPSEDNMLKITTDGRKLALDQRLLNDMLPDTENNKVSACAERCFTIWEETKGQKSAQLVFCDSSTPKKDGTFNVYDALKENVKIIPAALGEDCGLIGAACLILHDPS